MVWNYCGVILILYMFGWFLRFPALLALVFNFFVISVISMITVSAKRTKWMSQSQSGFKDIVDTWLWAPPTPTESCELASHQYIVHYDISFSYLDVLDHFLLICYENIVHIMHVTHIGPLELAIDLVVNAVCYRNHQSHQWHQLLICLGQATLDKNLL